MQLKLVFTAVCTLASAMPLPGAAQTYPVKPIRVIIPTAAGGGSDQIVRYLGNRYTAAWGQQIVALIACEGFTSTSVCPSGVALAAISMPMVMPAPGRLSATICWPQAAV